MILRAVKIIPLCILIFSAHISRANKIDSLKTTNDVKNFLANALSHTGIIYLHKPSNLLWGMYGNPNRGENYMSKYPPNFSFDEANEIMQRHSYSFYKEDIDHNGYTDLIVNAGITLIVLDFGDTLEGHMFSASSGWDSYSFKRTIYLQDGTEALVFRHDKNICRSYMQLKHSLQGGNIVFITKPSNISEGATDTLYKVYRGSDLVTEWLPHGKYRTVEKVYSDTEDMKLYNSTDTVVYKYGGFTKVKQGTHETIKKIAYYYYQSSNSIPNEGYTYVEIEKSGLCGIKHLGFNTQFEGNLKGKLLSNLFNLASYINVKSLNDSYWCPVSVDDSHLGALIITYDDGTKKTIYMSDFCPVLELGYLIKDISEISRSVKWITSDRKLDFVGPENLFSNATFPFLGECYCGQ